jgi:hypothetical protein
MKNRSAFEGELQKSRVMTPNCGCVELFHCASCDTDYIHDAKWPSGTLRCNNGHSADDRNKCSLCGITLCLHCTYDLDCTSVYALLEANLQPKLSIAEMVDEICAFCHPSKCSSERHPICDECYENYQDKCCEMMRKLYRDTVAQKRNHKGLMHNLTHELLFTPEGRLAPLPLGGVDYQNQKRALGELCGESV